MRQVDARTCSDSGSAGKVWGFKSPCCRFERDPVAVRLAMLSAPKPSSSKGKSLTARGPLFLLAKFQRCSVCCEHCGSKNQNQKRPIMRVCCLDACSEGASAAVACQAGGALGKARAGPGQGGKAPGEQALTVTAGNLVFPPVRPVRNCSNPSRAAQKKKQPTDRQ